ncbi:hypothetical protein WN51_11139 [Melipona quadrifasciata]|uniref:Uncharacterized protein n=1 Tax=Melipona quadrifasciata TaxID=166423 RepID=A0A0N0BHW8_9HYME|nr:hypothetical protein WN51_11139 [Melipona quadrifasciata]
MSAPRSLESCIALFRMFAAKFKNNRSYLKIWANFLRLRPILAILLPFLLREEIFYHFIAETKEINRGDGTINFRLEEAILRVELPMRGKNSRVLEEEEGVVIKIVSQRQKPLRDLLSKPFLTRCKKHAASLQIGEQNADRSNEVNREIYKSRMRRCGGPSPRNPSGPAFVTKAGKIQRFRQRIATNRYEFDELGFARIGYKVEGPGPVT